MERILGKPPYRIWTNANLDVWLVSESLPFEEEIELATWSLSWTEQDGEPLSVFKRLTPQYLDALRNRFRGVKDERTARFGELVKEHFVG